MAVYLIDYENTGVKGLVGIEKLQEDDEIILFYGPKTGAIPFDEHVKISQSASHVEYIKTTKTAKNYLDFQLTTYLGYLIAGTQVREYHVVSKDSGYDSVVDFWSKRGLIMKRQDNIAGNQTMALQPQKTAKKAGSKKAKTDKAKADKAKTEKTQAEKTGTEQTTTGKPAIQQTATGKPVIEQTVMGKSGTEQTTTGKIGIAKIETERPETERIEIAKIETEQPETERIEIAKIEAEQSEKEKVGAIEKTAEYETEYPADVPQANRAGAKAKTSENVPESVRKKIRAVLKPEQPQGGVYKQIYACMISANNKQTFNTALVKTFTQEKGNHYYKMLLQIFQEWKQKK